MRTYISVLLTTVLLIACGPKQKGDEVKTKTNEASPEPEVVSGYSFEIIPASENTFGYDIKKDGKLLIHQPHVPGIAGIKGFDTQNQAKAAAALMIDKIGKNIMPPTLSEHEIDSILSIRE
jgi:hypothetical protein